VAIVFAYIVYIVSGFFLAAALGAVIASLRGKANLHFNSSGFVIVTFAFFGIPCYLSGLYLQGHGNESFSLFILGIIVPLGILIGMQNRA
jgi:hypothetical protein